MANITLSIQSLINTAVYDSYTIDNDQTVAQLKTAIATARSYDTSWFALVSNNELLTDSGTLVASGLVNGAVIRTANKIGDLNTRELRQKAKLNLATVDRTASGNDRSTVDLTTLPTQFDNNTIVDNPNIGGLVAGRPWIETVNTFTFYEAFGTTTAISTTQYVSGNKIYAESSTYDVSDFQPARIVVNDIEIVNTEARGHTLAVLDSNGNTVSITHYDTYIDPGTLTTLASASSAVATGNIVVIVTYDATALNAAVRSAINTGFGSTNSNTWTASRVSHIFIGEKT